MNIVAENLTKTYDRNTALKKLNFRSESDRLCIIGQNGSGKTTLLSIITGLKRPTSGHLYVNNDEPYIHRNLVLSGTSYLFEKPLLQTSMRVSDFLDLVDRLNDFTDQVGLKRMLGLDKFEDKRVTRLSSGQTQLCGLYAGLANNANMVVLDEPFAHLDIIRAGQLLEYLSGRKGLIFATHSIEEAENISDFLVVLENGALKWAGKTSDLFTEDVYEITLVDKFEDLGLKKLYSMGNIIIARSSKEYLQSLFERGRILGFRLAGLRKVYLEECK